MLKVEDKGLVVPGELVAEGSDYLAGEGIFREGDNLYSSFLGLLSLRGKFLKIIPLKGRYIPAENDFIIGVVCDVMTSSWIVNINSPYDAILPLSAASERFIERGEEITRYFDIGDVIFTKVMDVTKSKSTAVTMRARGLRKLEGGRIIEIKPTKVPRVIGKGGTMVNMIKAETNSEIVVGQNGRIWIAAPPETENIVVEAILKIEREAHIPGLTDRVQKLLRDKNGKTGKTDSKGKEAGRKEDGPAPAPKD